MKKIQYVLIVLLLATAAPAQIPLNSSTEAMIRNGSNADVDMDESSVGYLMVKYSTAGSAGKSYFKFDFTGQNPNTNDALTLSFTTYSNNRQQHVQVWSLDQAYAAFTDNTLVWNTAQANDVGGNGLLTTGDFTATPLTEFISPNSAGVLASVSIPAPWGQSLVGNELVLVLATVNDSVNNANGTRITPGTTSLSFYPINSGSPPSIGAIPDITVMEGQASTNSLFTVGDPEDGPSALNPVMISSSDESVVPSWSVAFGGSDANRTVAVNPAGISGTATVTVQVYDSAGNGAQRTFNVTVIAADFPPTISTLPPTNTLLNTSVTIPFTIDDVETPADDLVVSAAVAEYSTAILSDVTFGGSGTNRTVTVTPVAGADGVGVVTISVTDANNATESTSFAVMVLPTPSTVFSDHFDYPLNTSILNSCPDFWTRRNSSAQSINFRTSSSDAQAWIRPKSGADDASAPLALGPFAPGSGAVLYMSFQAQWIELTDVPVVGDSSGAFILLAPNPTASADQLMRIATRTNGVPEGFFRLQVSNGYSDYTEHAMQDLSLWTTYNITARYDVDTATSTLWIDAVSEASPGVSASDAQNPAPVGYISIRQEPDMGNIYLDNLKVRVVRKPKLTSVAPPVAGNVELNFTGGEGDTGVDFGVERASSVNGPFEAAPATITAIGNNSFKATTPSSGDQSFYRLKRKPLDF